MRIASWGHGFLAGTLIALGILGLVTGDFPPTWVMVAGAWVLYVWLGDERGGPRLPIGEGGLRIARAFYGLAMIPFGTAHFVYLKETLAAMPGWLPWHVFWAYFTGGTFLAAG